MNLILTIQSALGGRRRRVVQNGQQITLGPSARDDFRVSGENSICIRRCGSEGLLDAGNAANLFLNGRRATSGHLHDGDVVEFEDATVTIRFRSTRNSAERTRLPDRLRSAETTFRTIPDAVDERLFSASSSNRGRRTSSYNKFD